MSESACADSRTGKRGTSWLALSTDRSKKDVERRVVCHLVHVAIGVVVAITHGVPRAIGGEREIDACPVARIHGE